MDGVVGSAAQDWKAWTMALHIFLAYLPVDNVIKTCFQPLVKQMV